MDIGTRFEAGAVRGGRLGAFARAAPRYSSPFRRWDSSSWVRAKPRRPHEFVAGLAFFPPALTPLARTAIDEARDPEALRDELTVQQLYAYLRLTVAIELFVVNRAAAVLYSKAVPIDVSADCARDALRIYTDEGGHAEMCETLALAVRATTGVEPVVHEPAFLGRLRALGDGRGGLSEELFALAAAVVSETLLTPALTELPADPGVQPAVRDVVRDHAEDERRHFAYFRRLHFRMWEQLRAEDRRAIGVLAPRMVAAFTAPDDRLGLDILARSPAFAGKPEACVEASSASMPAAEQRRRSALQTVRMFAECGALEDEPIAAAFAAEGLHP